MKSRWLALLAGLLCLSVGAGVASAELLGITPGAPLTGFNSLGTTTFNAGTGLLSITARPLQTNLADGGPVYTVFPPSSLEIRIYLDAAGNVTGGVAGPDFQMVGSIDTNGDGTPEYSGVLLSGEILAFGWLNADVWPLNVDLMDFRFFATGGSLLPLYGGSDIGLQLTIEFSTFNGSFTENFSGGAKGWVTPTPVGKTGCRVTAGGVDTFYLWDGTYEQGQMPLADVEPDRYQFGGQAGANTALPPQPAGEWEHHQQTGPSGSFSFHGGTHSAPAGTRIVEIRCSDPGGCTPSGNPPSPAKQLDFDAIGTFQEIGAGRKAPEWRIPSALVLAEAKGPGGKSFSGTYHWFTVNLDDLGEPGNSMMDLAGTALCPNLGFGELGALALANCDCPDFYRIRIYNGVRAADVIWTSDGKIDPSSLNRTDVIYEVYGYIKGGNIQIHKLTGFDTK